MVDARNAIVAPRSPTRQHYTILLRQSRVDLRAMMSEQISEFGRYQGFSSAAYDDAIRSSQYVTVRDGVRLAVDLFRPMRGGAVADTPLPALWTHTRYQRASHTQSGEVTSTLDLWDAWLFEVIRHGYVVATVDVRGAGASFGINRGQYCAEENRDAYDITEWIAGQEWCDGKVGMFGRSYLGITQYFAAGQAPPHLRAVFPEMASFDHYQYAYSGGVFRESSRFNWQLLVGNLDQSLSMLWKDDYQGPVVAVDEDTDGQLLAAALREHRANLDWYRMLKNCPYRDSVDPSSQEVVHQSRSPNSCVRQIEASGVAVYHLAGWYDMFPRDTLLWWRNLEVPQKLVIGPWFHVDRQNLDDAAEHLRWYDYWLKEIDNGVMSEDTLHYWTLDAPPGEEWRSTSCWPLENETPTDYYFAPGPSGTAASCNDGSLVREPGTPNSFEDYVADYTTTSGTTNRWANANGGSTGYPDMAANDDKGLTYTSAPLTHDLEVTGHPIVHVWLSCDTDDIALYAYLEDVHPDGYSQYVTEGVLLGSHRKQAEPPWDNLGLPYHSGLAVDLEPMPDNPVELVFDLHPTSKRFAAGHRIRIALTCADRDNDRTPIHDPPARLTLYRDAERASKIILPVIPG